MISLNFIKRIEQVLVELDISAIEVYVIIIIIGTCMVLCFRGSHTAMDYIQDSGGQTTVEETEGEEQQYVMMDQDSNNQIQQGVVLVDENNQVNN